MKNISLLPAEYKAYLKSEKKINRIAVVAAIVILIFVLFYASLSFSLIIPQAELDAVRNERELIQGRSGEMLTYEQMKDKISAGKSLYEQAMQDNPDWSSLLVQIFNTIPENVWLDQFSIEYLEDKSEYQENKSEYPENKRILTVRGWAGSHAKVADWLTALQQNENLRDVLCQSSAISGAEGNSTIQFEISAELVTAAANEVPAEGSEGK